MKFIPISKGGYEDTVVVIYSSKNKQITLAKWDGNVFRLDSNGSHTHLDSVSHFFPIPIMPHEEN